MKRLWIWFLLAGAVWTLLFAFVPGTRQELVFYGNENDRFCDYWIPRECAASVTTYRPDTVPRLDACYPPLGYVIAGVFPRDKWIGGLLFDISALVLLMGAVFCCAKGTKWNRVGWAVASSMLGQTLLALGVANQILLAAAGVCMFFAWHAKDDWRRLVALVALSVAVALKISPALFSLLLVRDRRWRDLSVVAVCSLVLGVVPFCWHGGIVGMLDLLENLRLHSDFYTVVDGWGFIAIGRSAYLAVGRGMDAFRADYLPYRMGNVLLALALIYPFFAGKFGRWRVSSDALLLALVVTLLPGCQHGYTALYFLPAVLCLPQDRLTIGHFLFFALFCPVQVLYGGFTVNHLVAALSAMLLCITQIELVPRQRCNT